ncbi:hypothetical protein ACROYT_G002831 [Oculina patagonica]
MADVELANVANQSTARCRVVARNGSASNSTTNKQPLSATDSYNIDDSAADDKLKGDSVDIGLIQRRTYLLSAGIGDTNRVFNRFKGWIGLVVWILNVIIHFGLDFYEAVFVFEVSWATCIGVFLITLLACCYSMIKHSVPWFIKGVRKLKKDGHYPKTLRRVYLIFKFMPIVVVMFAMGAAMGQFGCYAYDGALRLSFSKLSNRTGVEIPAGIDVLFNILRATSLFHIFYGFCLLLVFHLSLIFMIQSSMHEFNDRMGKLFRENPIQIAFPEAVNLFSGRAKFVREASQKSTVVLTTLLVACSTSFVLNAYNFLFLKRFAIYVWFAIAPLIWVVCPLTGAAWVTKTYMKYKLVVVNAWVDIPEEHELEASAHDYLHQTNSDGRSRSPSPVKTKWGSTIRRMAKPEKSQETSEKANNVAGVNNQGFKEDDTKPAVVNGSKKRLNSRKNSEISLHFSVDERTSKLKGGSLKGTALNRTPEILLTDCDEVTENVVPAQTLVIRRSRSESSLTDVEKVDRTLENQEAVLTGSSSNENVTDEGSRSHVVRIDIEGSQSSENQRTQLTSVSGDTLTTSSEFHTSFSSSTKSSDGEKNTEQLQVPSGEENANNTGDDKDSLPRVNFLTGMAKTFHQWRTKTKKKRKFNYENRNGCKQNTLRAEVCAVSF